MVSIIASQLKIQVDQLDVAVQRIQPSHCGIQAGHDRHDEVCVVTHHNILTLTRGKGVATGNDIVQVFIALQLHDTVPAIGGIDNVEQRILQVEDDLIQVVCDIENIMERLHQIEPILNCGFGTFPQHAEEHGGYDRDIVTDDEVVTVGTIDRVIPQLNVMRLRRQAVGFAERLKQRFRFMKVVHKPGQGRKDFDSKEVVNR